MGDHEARPWYQVLFLARDLAAVGDHGGNAQLAILAHAVPPIAAQEPPHRMQAARPRPCAVRRSLPVLSTQLSPGRGADGLRKPGLPILRPTLAGSND